MDIERMLKSINELKSKYDVEREKNRFNVFTAMYKDNEEVKLHSRFISYLLCAKSGHGMGNRFFKLFLEEVLLLTETEFDINSYQVVPNETDKREYEEIDIFITNKKWAIIIENKIDAPDSYHKDAKEGYRGQLERYYNTIKTGEDKNGNKRLKRETVFVYYLSNNKQPSEKSIGILKDSEDWRGVVAYGNEIRQWLDRCIKEVPLEMPSVKEFIQQYLNLINKMTHNDISKNEINELREQIANNPKSTQHLIDNFKHVKWHTVDDFWIELKQELEKHYKNVKTYSDYNVPNKRTEFHETISKVTHDKKDINHGILFDFEDGTTAYISGLRQLSWGIVNKGYFDFENEYTKGINFSNFSSENTYCLINRSNMEKVVELIVNEIRKEQKNNFKNLKTDNQM